MAEASSTLQRSASWFTIVGAVAAVVHYVAALLCKEALNIAPGWANVLGFACAFPVSYLGHHTLSFAHQPSRHAHALPRFLLVALLGFCGNQVLLLSLLQVTPLPFWLVLGLVMVAVALSSFLLSRYWAFRPR